MQLLPLFSGARMVSREVNFPSQLQPPARAGRRVSNSNDDGDDNDDGDGDGDDDDDDI